MNDVNIYVETFMKSNVITPIVSVINTGLKLFSIDRSEIEDLIYFVNT